MTTYIQENLCKSIENGTDFKEVICLGSQNIVMVIIWDTNKAIDIGS